MQIRGLKNPEIKSLYSSKVNINKLQEFYKIGIDLNKLTFLGTGNWWKALSKESVIYGWYSYRFFTTDIIAVGTVIDSSETLHSQFISNSNRILNQLEEIDFTFSPIAMIDLISETAQELFSDNRAFKTMYQIRIVDFIKGKYYYREDNPTITLFASKFEEASLKKGQKVLMFLPLKDDPSGYWQEIYSYFSKGNELYNSLKYVTDFDSYYAIEKNGKIDGFEMSLSTDSVNSVEKVALYLHKLEKINDTSNFYKRSYK